MAIKIPDAPNIVGGEEVLRSPDMVSPVRERFQGKVDFGGLQESVGDVTKYYEGMVRDQTNTWMTEGKNEYLQHMTSFTNKIYEDHQGKNAQDLYARFIKPESDNWLKNKFGEPKDDGQVRIVDKELQKQFSSWVDTQQPHFISSSANYEEREWDKFRESAFEARDNIAAKLILNATTNDTIQNGINAFRENTYEQNPGLDKDFIEQAIASKIDTSLAAHLNQMAEKDPVGAFEEMNSYPTVVENLSATSRKSVTDTIRKCYKNIAIDQAAKARAGLSGGSFGMMENQGVIGQIFGDYETADVMSEIDTKSKERAEALKKAQAGQKERMTNDAMQGLLNAKTEDEWNQAMGGLALVDSKIAQAMDSKRNEWLANQQDIATAGIGLDERYKTIDEQMKDRFAEPVREKLEASGQIPEGELDNATAAAMRALGSSYRSEVEGADLEAVINSMVEEEGELNRPRIEAAARIWKTSMQRKNQMPKYKELSAKISSGEIRAYDADLMGDLDWSIQQQLIYQIDNNNKYFSTKNDLLQAGVSIDKVLSESGIDAQYDKLDLDSQNLLKRNLVYEINAARERNNGRLPDEDSIKGIALRVQRNSVSPIMAVLQDEALAENLSSNDLTDVQRYNLSVMESMSWDYNKPQARGLKDQQKRAKNVVEKLASSSRLSREERDYIKQNTTYLVSLLQAGDLVGMSEFIGLAKQGGF